ncbi:MAG: 16S rRNA (uracil(1498)-N(3))-methyltransferase [Verrucomicrobiota bacterium]
MDRFFCSRERWGEGEALLDGEEWHHAVRVMRKKAGDVVEVFDGSGRVARGEVEEVSKSELRVRLGEILFVEKEGPEVCLVVAIPKGKTMELIVQKAVELGVTRIQPLVTANTVVRLAGEERVEKARKWQRVALEACKQCGQNWLPVVEEVRGFEEWLGEFEGGEAVMGSLGKGAFPLKDVLASWKEVERVSALVGPEGDLSEGERQAAEAKGFAPADLGGIVLRVETACLYLMSCLRFSLSG